VSVNSRTPELEEVIRKAIAATLSSLHVGMPGAVLAYDPKTQTVDVQPLIKSRNTSTETPAALPVLKGVPVKFPRAGGFRITFPVQVGDKVHLEFCERAIDGWIHNGGQQPVDPVELRRHSLSDAVACLGLYDQQDLGSAPDGSALVVGKDGGSELKIDGTNVTINAPGPGAIIKLNVGAGGKIQLGGAGKFIAMTGDTAGPWPLVIKTIMVSGAALLLGAGLALLAGF
jgi:hypothetical protein